MRGRPGGQRQTRLKPAEVDELVHRRSDGATIAEVAGRFGIRRTTVMAHLRRRHGTFEASDAREYGAFSFGPKQDGPSGAAGAIIAARYRSAPPDRQSQG
jgi:hypothetical protein